MISKKWLLISFIVFILGVGLAFAFAQTNGIKKWHGDKSCFNEQLTDSQKEAFYEAMQELKGSDLSYEEMKQAKLDLMEELGIEFDKTSCWSHGDKWKGSFKDKKGFFKGNHEYRCGK